MTRTALLLSIALLGGCMSTPVQTAETLGEGNFQFGVEPGAMGVAAGGGVGVIPSFDISGRYGISDKTDFGARLGSSVYEIWVKQMISDYDNASGPIVSIVPTGSLFFVGGGGGGGGFVNLKVPVLIGFGRESQFVLGPYVGNTLVLGGGGGEAAVGYGLTLGSSVGYSAKLNDGFRLMPELGLGYPLLGAVGASGGGSGTDVGSNSLIFSFKLGIIAGKGR